MEKGKVLLTRDDKLLLLSNNRYFIAKGVAKVGDDVDFDVEKSLAMPSYLLLSQPWKKRTLMRH